MANLLIDCVGSRSRRPKRRPGVVQDLTDALKTVTDEAVHLNKSKATRRRSFGDHQEKCVILEGVDYKAVAYNAKSSVEV